MMQKITKHGTRLMLVKWLSVMLALMLLTPGNMILAGAEQQSPAPNVQTQEGLESALGDSNLSDINIDINIDINDGTSLTIPEGDFSNKTITLYVGALGSEAPEDETSHLALQGSVKALFIFNDEDNTESFNAFELEAELNGEAVVLTLNIGTGISVVLMNDDGSIAAFIDENGDIALNPESVSANANTVYITAKWNPGSDSDSDNEGAGKGPERIRSHETYVEGDGIYGKAKVSNYGGLTGTLQLFKDGIYIKEIANLKIDENGYFEGGFDGLADGSYQLRFKVGGQMQRSAKFNIGSGPAPTNTPDDSPPAPTNTPEPQENTAEATATPVPTEVATPTPEPVAKVSSILPTLGDDGASVTVLINIRDLTDLVTVYIELNPMDEQGTPQSGTANNVGIAPLNYSFSNVAPGKYNVKAYILHEGVAWGAISPSVTVPEAVVIKNIVALVDGQKVTVTADVENYNSIVDIMIDAQHKASIVPTGGRVATVFGNVDPGTYTVTVTAGSVVDTSASFTVIEPPAVKNVAALVDGAKVTVTADIENYDEGVIIELDGAGQTTVTPVGGAITAEFMNVDPGTYSATVTAGSASGTSAEFIVEKQPTVSNVRATANYQEVTVTANVIDYKDTDTATISIYAKSYSEPQNVVSNVAIVNGQISYVYDKVDVGSYYTAKVAVGSASGGSSGFTVTAAPPTISDISFVTNRVDAWKGTLTVTASFENADNYSQAAFTLLGITNQAVPEEGSYTGGGRVNISNGTATCTFTFTNLNAIWAGTSYSVRVNIPGTTVLKTKEVPKVE